MALLASTALGSSAVSTPAFGQTQQGSSGQQNVQDTEQNAIVIGEKNRIQQKIKECNAQQQLNSSSLQQNLQSGLQSATATGEKNHIKQRIDLCSTQLQPPGALGTQESLQDAEQNATTSGERTASNKESSNITFNSK